MNIPLIDLDPTEREVEKFRLILSTFQDGSGQLKGKQQSTLPGWRDFERAIAVSFGGIAQENKHIFDVLIPDVNRPGIYFGISCKMRRALNDTFKTNRVTLELSNSSGKFWKELALNGIEQRNYKQYPIQVGKILLSMVERWHHQVGISNGGSIDLERSYYLVLAWNARGMYQLYKFKLKLPEAEQLVWDFPDVNDESQQIQRSGRRLRGQDKDGTIFEWYGESGGQLKYYPRVQDALWKSRVFNLEPIGSSCGIEEILLSKAKLYFSAMWENIAN